MGEKKLKWLAQKRHWLLDGIVLSAMHGHAQEPRPRVAAAAQLTACEKRRLRRSPPTVITPGGRPLLVAFSISPPDN